MYPNYMTSTPQIYYKQNRRLAEKDPLRRFTNAAGLGRMAKGAELF